MICSIVKWFLHDQRGASVVLFALTLPISVGVLGLGAETALWFYKQRELQKIVDVAAYNGAVEFSDSNSASSAVVAAEKDAVFHGFDAGTGTLTINTSVADQSVEAIVDATYPRLFSALFRDEPVTISVRAVATYRADGTACLLSLHLDASRAIEIAGSADVDLVGCSVMSNSVAEEAFYQGGNGHINTPCVRAVGGIVQSGGINLTECNEPWPYSPKADDPFASVSAPALPAVCSSVPSGSGTIDVPPGRYCSGFTLNGDYNLTGGVYIVDGGTFQANSGAKITGDNVTIYLTNNADLSWNGHASITLKAPTSGAYEGILIFADRDASDTNELKLNGTANSALVGAIYAPKRQVTMLGDFQGSNGCTQIVASTILLSGNNSFSANCTGMGTVNIAMAGRTRLTQ